MIRIAIDSLRRQVADPFGFETAFVGLSLAPEELPSLTREARLLGYGR